MKINIHEGAAGEFDEAVEWYEIQSKGLGKRFKKSVTDQLKKIKKKSELVFERNRQYLQGIRPEVSI